MKAFLLILAVVISVQAREPKDALKWIPIKEMTGEIPDHEGLTIEVYAAEIARRDDGVKLLIRLVYPWGSPADIFREAVPHGFDPSSIYRIQGRIDLNCTTLVITPITGSAEVFQFNGKRHKSKEPPFKIMNSHLLATYFCEQGPTPTTAPKLKPKINP